MPLRDGEWTPAGARPGADRRAPAPARPQPRRSCGVAAKEGRLAFGYLEDLFPERRRASATSTPRRRETGLEPELIRRIWSAAGFSAASLEHLSEDDVALLQRLRRGAGRRPAARRLPAARARVRAGAGADRRRRGQALPPLRPRADDPRRRRRCSTSRRSSRISPSELLPLAGPIMESVHQRLLQHSSSRTSSATSSWSTDDAALGRVRVAIAFADLAGYTRLTEEVGEEEALEVVERFVELVGETLPDDARVIKTIGDEVMVVGTDPSALVDWAVGLARALDRAPAAADRRPRRQRALPRRRLLRPRGRTSRRASARGRPAARCSSRARSSEAAGRHLALPADRRGQAQGLRRGHRAVPGGRR